MDSAAREQADAARDAFVRYRARREPADLALVFDATAQELLIVAHHLARPGVAPEDLLQGTFLEAIRTAERFDATRPLVPWLCGILVNLARSHGRAAARTFDPERVHASTPDDPVELAHAREFAAAISAALREFPARQREVLTLRIVHGLTPTEIAHALGLPVGSVKSWIHRGLERLKQVLPASFAAALVGLARAERSLDELRDELLASVLSSPPPAPIAGPWRRIAGWSAVAGLAVLVTVLATLRATRDSPREPPTHDVATAAAPRDEAALASVSDAGAGERSAVAAPQEPRPEPEFVLRVRHGTDGSPAELTARLEPRSGIDAQLRGVSLRTDATGTARARGLPPGYYELLADRGEPELITIAAGFSEHELELAPGELVRGRVRDAEGRPIAGARIWLSRHRRLDEGEIAAHCDAAGEFELRDVPAGRAIAALSDGWAVSPLAVVGGEREYELLLDTRAARIAGHVRDERGEPIADALIAVGAGFDARWTAESLAAHHMRPPLCLATGADGRFECASVPAGDALRVWIRAAEFAPQELELRATLGANAELNFVLERGAVWRGHLFADLSPGMAAVLAASPRPLTPGAEQSRAPRWLRTTAFVEGALPFELRGLGAGPYTLRAQLADGRTTAREVELRPGESFEWSPDLRASRTLRGSVTAPAGTSLAGMRVRASFESMAPRWADVGAAGEFALERVAGAPCDLTLFAPDGAFGGALALAPSIAADTDYVELALPAEMRPSASLRATVLALDGAPFDGVRALALRDGSTTHARRAADGRLEFGPLPPGSYWLVAGTPTELRVLQGPFAVAADERADAGTVRELPGSRVRVRLTGATPAGANSVLIQTLDGAALAGVIELHGGAGESARIVPGRYRAVLVGDEFALAQTPLDVPVGGSVDCELVARSGVVLTIELAHCELGHGAGVRLELTRARDGAVFVHGDEDPRGRGRVPYTYSLEPGRWNVAARSTTGRAGAVDVDVEASGVPPRLVLELR